MSLCESTSQSCVQTGESTAILELVPAAAGAGGGRGGRDNRITDLKNNRGRFIIQHQVAVIAIFNVKLWANSEGVSRGGAVTLLIALAAQWDKPRHFARPKRYIRITEPGDLTFDTARSSFVSKVTYPLAITGIALPLHAIIVLTMVADSTFGRFLR